MKTYLRVVKDEESLVGEVHRDAHGVIHQARNYDGCLEQGAKHDVILTVADAEELDEEATSELQADAGSRKRERGALGGAMGAPFAGPVERDGGGDVGAAIRGIVLLGHLPGAQKEKA